MRKWLALSLLLLAPPLLASEHCRFQAPQKLDLDLAGVQTLEIDLGRHDLHLQGSADATAVQVRGRACASSQQLLDSLHVVQQRRGDRLIVRAEDDSSWSSGWLGNRYAYLDLQVKVPATLAVVLDTGSGDADVSGLASLDSRTGSGDLRVRRVKGAFATRTGSGDVVAKDVGSLHLASVGSGDASVDGVRGDAVVGNVGSGDLRLDNVHGKVSIDAVGSGDVTLRDIGGGVDVGALGSGDLDVDGVGGDLVVRSNGSGDIDHDNVRGKVDIPRDD